MSRFLQTAVLLIIILGTNKARSQSFLWTVPEQWGVGTTIPNKVVQAGSGHLMISGGYGASKNDGCGGMYISKYDSQGNRMWSDSLNYGKNWAGPAVSPNGSSYHFIYKYPSFFIRKYSNAGVKLFDVPISNRAIEGSDLIYAPDGYLYLTGCIHDSAQIGQNTLSSGGYISKLDTTGQIIWTRHVKLNNNTNYTDVAKAMRVKYFNGNLFVLGALKGDVSVGSFNLNGYSSYYLKLDSAGTVINASELPVMCEDMEMDEDGGLYFKGEFAGSATFGQTTVTQTTSDYFSYCVAKYDGNNWLWAKELPGIGRGALSVNADKEVYCLGNSSINNWNKIYNMSRLDSTGNFTWSYTSNPTSNPQDQFATNILANNKDIYVIGQSVHGFLTKFSSTTTSIKEGVENSTIISVYPNPSSDVFNISLPEDFKNSKIYITDIQGRTVMMIDNGSKDKFSIDLSSLPAAEYILNIVANGNKYSKSVLRL